MSEIGLSWNEGTATVEIDESLYPKDAVYGAAYTFIDRCYVLLERADAGKIRIRLREKRAGGLDAATVAGELENELLAQAWRRLLAEENRAYIEATTARALGGAAGPPGLDELLDMDIGEASAFEDPLGIAMSWEEKYKKKSADAESAAAPAPTEDES
jgi:His-Xaa-Ser system protein HxsD